MIKIDHEGHREPMIVHLLLDGRQTLHLLLDALGLYKPWFFSVVVSPSKNCDSIIDASTLLCWTCGFIMDESRWQKMIGIDISKFGGTCWCFRCLPGKYMLPSHAVA
ncbi:hypothetical protein V8G54_007024 [Vigna mungo]|uniref:Uncharacterized protein n=1 Tax=Vigna mungo TaxID=3915 RepID=A0AAQ3P398_VIGMU